MKERLQRGDPGINKLDDACKEHDIAYDKFSDTANRNKADIVLADKAWERVKAGDSSLGERAAAYAVTNAMKLKAKLGAGCGRKKKDGAGLAEKKKKKKKKKCCSAASKKKERVIPRVIPLPKTGGNVRSILNRFGVASRSVEPAVKKIQTILEREKQRSVKVGKGLYLRPYKNGYGLYLRPEPLN